MPGEMHRFTPYLSIVAGKFSKKVDEGTPGSRRRDYELPSGVKGTKYEIIYDLWTGVVRELTFQNNEKGTFLNIVFDDATVSLGTESRYFSDFIKKLAVVVAGETEVNDEKIKLDIALPITLKPYAFTVPDGKDKGQKKSGMNVFQGETKLGDFFFDYETKTNLNDFPVPEGDTSQYTKNDWKIYFAICQKFLINYTKLVIAPKLTGEVAEEVKIGEPSMMNLDKEDLDVNDVPY